MLRGAYRPYGRSYGSAQRNAGRGDHYSRIRFFQSVFRQDPLASAELCVCDIASLLNMSQSAISHQLRFLKQARLVKSRKTGKTVYYALCDDHIQTILAQGIAHVQEG